ncbi:glycosyltransferase family 4 protein [Xylophilus sp. GOD-11R]|uniref:glycosyltransferase family 4 protein n=1 Tax=Xylophilus sp. GOD-11R TaxID=3089814 RepID=UPI00298D4224|nr:glycosyltransferase family 4 protein [Xylophilus sp. GOD-11R]WPB56745.1 glycosyltransferase family 4 protein [Xylophilus sp. GOD-11R]
MAGPLGPNGGGMLRVVDYLIQAQDGFECYRDAHMVKLDTRGGGSPASSFIYLGRAMATILRSRIDGSLAGLHVNMAERLSVLRKGILVMFARSLGIPAVLHLHAAQMESYYRTASAPTRLFTRSIFRMTTHNIVLGDNSRRFLIDVIGISPDKVSIVINGVPGPANLPESRPDRPRKRVLFLGNLSDRKGPADLLQAVADPRFDPETMEVFIVGGGDVEKYRRLSDRLGLQRLVSFLGWVDQAKAAEVLRSADVMILPSYDEGLPLVVLEALANGIPTICTPVGEIPTVLQNRVDTLFVKPGDIQAIADNLIDALTDGELRRSLVKNGRKAYENRFSLAKFSSSVAAIHAKHFKLSH